VIFRNDEMVGDLLALLPWILSLAALVYYLVAIHAARRFFSQPIRMPAVDKPAVSILIPLCGADFRAYENYASVCRQDYPVFQLVFGVMDPRDSSLAVIRKLKTDFPETDIELVVDGAAHGSNPKISNLCNMMRGARHEVLVLLDSDIRIQPGFLTRVAPHALNPKIGLATCFYRGAGAPGTAARVEAVGITAEFAAGVLVAWLTEGMSFALGAAVATTRDKLAAIGGFEALADYLADDYMLGQLFRKAGYEVQLLPEVVETVLPRASFAQLLKHQVRWSRGIRACRPGGHAGLIFTHGTVMALANWVVCGGSPPSTMLLTVVLGARLWMAWTVGVKHLGDALLARSFLLLPVRDLFSFLVWCVSLVGRRVEWRGRSYRIVHGGRIVEEG
jgi:ceramide glucosyltransferase